MESAGLAESTSGIRRPVHTKLLSTLNINTEELGAGL